MATLKQQATLGINFVTLKDIQLMERISFHFDKDFVFYNKMDKTAITQTAIDASAKGATLAEVSKIINDYADANVPYQTPANILYSIAIFGKEAKDHWLEYNQITTSTYHSATFASDYLTAYDAKYGFTDKPLTAVDAQIANSLGLKGDAIAFNSILSNKSVTTDQAKTWINQNLGNAQTIFDTLKSIGATDSMVANLFSIDVKAVDQYFTDNHITNLTPIQLAGQNINEVA